MKTKRFIAIGGIVGGWLFVFSLMISQIFISHASTITTINGSDTISASRSVINTNFSNLNSDKIQSGDTTSSVYSV